MSFCKNKTLTRFEISLKKMTDTFTNLEKNLFVINQMKVNKSCNKVSHVKIRKGEQIRNLIRPLWKINLY